MKGASTLKILYMKIHQNNFNQFIEHCINNDFQAVGLEAMNEILVKLFETNGYGVFKMPEDNFGRYLKIVKEGNSTLVFTHQKSQSEKVDVIDIQTALSRSEERRVGKECEDGWTAG